jgi:ectoine hydroxylase-related dioxygenase (phytanoyl-CoA dioxygenase family)
VEGSVEVFKPDSDVVIEMQAADAEYRTSSLEPDEVGRYRREGFLLPGKVLSDRTVERLRASLDELSSGEVANGTIHVDLMRRTGENKGTSFDYLGFLWKTRPEFAEVAFSPHLAQMAAQLLDTDKVVLLGDAAFIKPPLKGGKLYWHQDAMAWPLDKPGGLTCWIALDEATPESGSMSFAVGSHLLGERLPVEATTGAVLRQGYTDSRQASAGRQKGRDLSASGLKPVTSPEEEGLPQVQTRYLPGECSFHDSLVWHASGVNTSPNYRRAFSLRYVDGHRIWLGEQKAFYYFADDEAGVEVGAPVGGPNFPTVWPPSSPPATRKGEDVDRATGASR